MPTKEDRRAVVVLLALALAGLGVRLVTGGTVRPGAVGYRAVAGARPARDTVAERARTLSRPLRADEQVDLDRAPAAELARLPRIGPGLAARIVAEREAGGPFGSLEGLQRVRGLGARTLEAIRPHATFSGRARAGRTHASRTDLVAVNTAPIADLQRLPGIGPALAAAIVAERNRTPFRTADDLLRVRGIGPHTLDRLRDRIRVP